MERNFSIELVSNLSNYFSRINSGERIVSIREFCSRSAGYAQSNKKREKRRRKENPLH